MRKIFIILFVFILSGCQGYSTNEIEEKVDTIDTAKYATAKNITLSLINNAEVKYLEDSIYYNEKECYDISELNASSEVKRGRVCITNNGYTAYDIEILGYICNGNFDSVVCEEIK